MDATAKPAVCGRSVGIADVGREQYSSSTTRLSRTLSLSGSDQPSRPPDCDPLARHPPGVWKPTSPTHAPAPRTGGLVDSKPVQEADAPTRASPCHQHVRVHMQTPSRPSAGDSSHSVMGSVSLCSDGCLRAEARPFITTSTGRANTARHGGRPTHLDFGRLPSALVILR